MRPLVIGFVGSIGCGKTARSAYLASLFSEAVSRSEAAAAHAVQLRALLPEGTGLHRIDCDKVGHSAYAPGTSCYAAVVSRFGRGILSEGGSGAGSPPVDRRKLGAVVFADKGELQALNGIVWPAISADVLGQVDALVAAAPAATPPCIFVEGALLVELEAIANRCDALWFFHATREVALARVVGRDGLDESAAARRIDAQPTLESRLEAASRLPSKPEVRVFDTSHDSVESGCAAAFDALRDLVAARASS